MPASLETTGTLHGLTRKIGKIGGEHIVFVVTCRDLTAWQKLVAMTEGEVSIALVAAQGELDIEASEKPKGRRGPGKGQAAAAGDNGDGADEGAGAEA